MRTQLHIPQYMQTGCMSEFAGCPSTVKNNTAKVLCTTNIPIKGSCNLTFKLCFCLLSETCISLEIFSISTHVCLNCFHDFSEIKLPFLNHGIYCHFIMVAGIYKMLFSSPPLHTWDNNDYQSHHTKLRCHYWVRVWKGCSRENHLYVDPNPALIEGHSRMTPVSLTLNDPGLLYHFRGRHSPKLRAFHFFISHGITSSFPLCLFNSEILTLRNKLCLRATAVETQLCLFSFSS